MSARCPVFIILSDADMRRLLVKKLSAQGYQPTPFANGADFVGSLDYLPSGVALVDLQSPETSGTTLLEVLLSRRRDIPLILTAARTDIRTVVQAIKKGADDFLEQPFSDEVLLSTLGQACSLLPARSVWQQRKIDAENCLRNLTAKEREILQAARIDPDNRIIADRFHLSLRTVETYRTRIIKKCGVRRFAEAISLCDLAQGGRRAR